MSENKQLSFDRIQAEFFDEIAIDFSAPPPEDAAINLKRIIEMMAIQKDSRILDVGTGQGVLIPYFIKAGAQPGNILACDLSAEMVTRARQKNSEIQFYIGNVIDIDPTMVKELTGRSEILFDKVVFNACFGNFEDGSHVLRLIKKNLSGKAEIIISHPLGAKFVKFLNKREAHIVPNLLPNQEDMLSLAEASGYKCIELIDDEDFYFAKLIPLIND